MILTDKDTICNRYIRRQIRRYKEKKAELINLANVSQVLFKSF